MDLLSQQMSARVLCLEHMHTDLYLKRHVTDTFEHRRRMLMDWISALEAGILTVSLCVQTRGNYWIKGRMLKAQRNPRTTPFAHKHWPITCVHMLHISSSLLFHNAHAQVLPPSTPAWKSVNEGQFINTMVLRAPCRRKTGVGVAIAIVVVVAVVTRKSPRKQKNKISFWRFGKSIPAHSDCEASTESVGHKSMLLLE